MRAQITNKWEEQKYIELQQIDKEVERVKERERQLLARTLDKPGENSDTTASHVFKIINVWCTLLQNQKSNDDDLFFIHATLKIMLL